MDRKLDDATLMRYLDGELGRDEARDVERLVEGDPQLQAKAEALAQLGSIVTARYDAAADEVDARLASMWDDLAPKLGPARAPPAEERGGFLASVRDWFEHYRSHLLTGVLAAAAGAVIATFAAGRGQPPGVQQPVVAPIAAAAAEVESLEVADGTAAVLQVPGEQPGEGNTLIWITPSTEGAI